MTGSDSSGARRQKTLREIAFRIWVTVVLGVSVVIFLAALDVAKSVPSRSDFATFYSVGTLVREGLAVQAYDNQTLSTQISTVLGVGEVDLRWLYPPAMLIVTWPLAYFTPSIAYLIWLGIGLAGLALVAWRLAPHPLALVLLPFCPAVTYCAVTGQVGLFATALAGAGFLALERRPVLAGVLLGLLALKVQLVIVLPFCLLAGRHYRALIAMAATAIIAQTPGLALVGVGNALAFMMGSSRMLISVAGDPQILKRIPTVYSLLVGASASHAVALTAQTAACLAVIAGLWAIWRRTNDIATRSLGWAAGSLLATPFAFDYDLVIFALPLAALAWQATQLRIGWLDVAVMTLLWFAAILVKPAAAAAGFQLGPFASAALLAYAGWRAMHAPESPARSLSPK